MKACAELFLRGFAHVSLISWNVCCITRRQWALAFISSFLLSANWTMSVSRVANHKGLLPKACYALGAAIGCVVGMLIGNIGA